MKVSSPVGDFPFEPSRLMIAKGRLVVEGGMGAWPARVEIEPADIITVVRLIPWPALALAGLALAGGLATLRRR